MGLRESKLLTLSDLASLALALSACALGIALFGDEGRAALAFDRHALAAEPWRFFSGHLAHLGWSHLVLNLVGLLLVALLLGDGLSAREWWAAALFSSCAVSLGLWAFNPQLGSYVGLSGVLHGLLVAGIAGAFRKRPLESAALGALIAGKLVYEQLAGPLPGSESSSGGAVIVDAHLYGAIGGILFGIIVVIRTRAGRRQN